MKSALITVTTWRFERIVKVFRVYIANICWLPLCCYGYSLNLPICRSRVRIPQGFFSSWTVVQFLKKDFPPKLIFFFYSKSKTCKKSISLEVRGFFFQVVEDPYHVWKKILVQLGVEPRTFRVWGERDNHYTTEPAAHRRSKCWIVKCSLTKIIISKIGLKTDTDREIKWKKDMISLILTFLYFIV